jgi:hypothetical protein
MVLLSDVIAFYEEYYSTTNITPSADELKALRGAIKALRKLKRTLKHKRK